MNQGNEEKETDLQDQIAPYKEEFDEISEKYLNLQKKYEMMKILELNLRYEIYELKQQLNKSQPNENINHNHKEQPMNLKYISILLEHMLDLLNRTLDQEHNDEKTFIHRPSNENNHATGLGKESLLRMRDSHETNEKKLPQHKEEDIQANDTDLTKNVSDQNQKQTSTNEHMNQSIHQQTDQTLKNQQKNQGSTSEKKAKLEHVKTNNHPEKKEIKNFHELKQLVHDLKYQGNSSDQQPIEKKTNQTSNDQTATVENKLPDKRSSDFTFRDIQKAKQIYSKPLPRMNTITTTRIKRKIQSHVLGNEQDNQGQVIVNKHASDVVGPKKDDQKEIQGQEKLLEETSAHQKEQTENVESNLEENIGENKASFEKDETIHEKQTEESNVNHQDKQADESNLTIDTKSDIQDHLVKNDDHVEQENNHSKELKTTTNDDQIEQLPTTHQNDESKRQTTERNEAREEVDHQTKEQKATEKSGEHSTVNENYKTESETNQNISNEFESRDDDHTQSKQSKNESFLETLWKIFR